MRKPEKWTSVVVTEETRKKLHQVREHIREKLGLKKMSLEDTINFLIKYYEDREKFPSS
jgi:phosphopantetheine adenylyltransferase